MRMDNDTLGNASSHLATQTTGQSLSVVALLYLPRQALCFRDFAVATSQVLKRHAMVGILWQETATEGSRIALYYYNVPCFPLIFFRILPARRRLWARILLVDRTMM